MEEIKKVIECLRRKLRHWEYLYYIENYSEISDDEYDRYMEELRFLENKYPFLVTVDSPTQRLGGKVKNRFFPIYHTVPMLSLDNVFDELSLLNFDKQIRIKLGCGSYQDISYCCELKIDGVGINLIYEHGVLVHGATRGDGIIGENVTENIRTIRSIPLRLKDDKNFPEFLEVRGEVFMDNDSFLKLNQLFIQSGMKTFSNPRNAASGSLRHVDSSVTSKRYLDFFCYHIAHCVLRDNTQKLSDSHLEQLLQCNAWGFPILKNYTRICIGFYEVLQYFKNIQKIRSCLKFNIDGIVVKVNSIVLQNKLGTASRAPRWAVSYKFQSKQSITRVLDIRFQISRQGLLIPIASLEPVFISGVLIQNVNLHNVGIIYRLDLMLGDSVIIHRAGDVIPQIIRVVLSDRLFNDVRPIIYPDYCPSCNSLLYQVIFKKTLFLKCTAGLNCFDQRKEILKHFVSRKAMNIMGMGSSIINQLMCAGLLYTPVDFFKLDINSLSSINGIKRQLAKRLLNSIEISKKTTLSRFIYALAIPNVGKNTSLILARVYKNIDSLMVADLVSLLSVQDIGSVVACNVFNFFRNDYNLSIIDGLLSSEIRIQTEI